jgi:uncharacterized protein (DUF885 family)
VGGDSLQKVADDAWQHWLVRDIQLREKFGLPIEHLPDISFDAAQRDAAFAQSILRRLDAIAPANEDERLTIGTLRWQSQRDVDFVESFWHCFPVTPYRTPLFPIHNVLSRMPDADHLRAELPRVVDQILDILGEQERRRILIPQDEIPTVRAMLSDLTKSLSPDMQRLADHFDDAYAARAPDGVGMWQYPGGAEAYRAFVREETTLDLTPEQIHDLGLREMVRIGDELDAIRQELGLGGSLAKFRRALKTDPRFYVQTPEEVAARLLAHVRRIEPHIPRFFARTPKAPYGLKRDNPAFESSATFGYYQPPTAAEPAGFYYFNGSMLHERNLLTAAALIAHELIPGHHFQIARQEENEALPMIRRESFPNAYTEGWGEYAAWLGIEMGYYDDPYDRAGRLMLDAMLSARLVVDTGMNAFRWTRQRASDYLREHTMLSDTEIATETLRYAVDIPAQALAYKIGSAKMLELRALAQRELGPRFDVRAFHEWIIGSGALPLPLLEEHVRHEIAAARSAAST